MNSDITAASGAAVDRVSGIALTTYPLGGSVPAGREVERGRRVPSALRVGDELFQRIASLGRSQAAAGPTNWDITARVGRRSELRFQHCSDHSASEWAHGSEDQVREYRAAYDRVMVAYDIASAEYRESGVLCPFPEGTFPPRIQVPKEAT